MKAWMLAPLALLAACGTPQEQCIARNTRELAKVQRLAAEVQGNLARGYAYETEVITVPRWVRCDMPPPPPPPGGDPNLPPPPPPPPRMCLDDVQETIRREVPIDPAAEQRKLDGLLARVAELQRAAEPAIAACRAQYPE